MKRLLACGLVFGLTAFLFPARSALADKGDDPKTSKEGLQALNDFIGEWKGSGGPDKVKPGPRDAVWTEALEWVWKFKGDDAWLVLNFKDSKNYKSGEMRYLPEKKVYQLTMTTKDDKKQVFEGPLDTRQERTDAGPHRPGHQGDAADHHEHGGGGRAVHLPHGAQGGGVEASPQGLPGAGDAQSASRSAPRRRRTFAWSAAASARCRSATRARPFGSAAPAAPTPSRRTRKNTSPSSRRRRA